MSGGFIQLPVVLSQSDVKHIDLAQMVPERFMLDTFGYVDETALLHKWVNPTGTINKVGNSSFVEIETVGAVAGNTAALTKKAFWAVRGTGFAENAITYKTKVQRRSNFIQLFVGLATAEPNANVATDALFYGGDRIGFVGGTDSAFTNNNWNGYASKSGVDEFIDSGVSNSESFARELEFTIDSDGQVEFFIDGVSFGKTSVSPDVRPTGQLFPMAFIRNTAASITELDWGGLSVSSTVKNI